MNFQEALTQTIGDIERPPNIPLGTYTMTVAKQPSFDSIAQGDYEVCDFMLKIVAATDDVDADDIEAYPGEFVGSQIRHRFMFDTNDEVKFQRSLFNLKRFLEDHLQVEGAAKKDLKQTLAESVNHHCLATVQWRPDKNDPEVLYSEIRATAPVE